MNDEYGSLVYGSLTQAENNVRSIPITQEHLKDCERHHNIFNCRAALPCGFEKYHRGDNISCDTCACGYSMVIREDNQTSYIWLCKMDYLSAEDYKRFRNEYN